MQVLLDNNTISEYSFVEEGMNSLGYDSLNEVFFDVFEIKFKDFELVKEKKGDFNGNPIIEVDVRIKNEIFKNVRFVLSKENKIKINPNLLDYTKVVVYENKNKIVSPVLPVKKPEKTKLSNSVVKENIIEKPKPIIVEQSLIEKTKAEFFESIKGEVLEELKREVKAGIIADLIKESLQSNFDSVITDTGSRNKLHKILENFNNTFRKEYIDLAEKVSRREAMRVAEGGGGTNAVQYANGGIMNGDLTVTGNFQSTNISVAGINVDSLNVNSLNVNTIQVDTLTANNQFINNNLIVSGELSAQNIDVDTLKVKTLSADNQFITYNLSVNQGISANNVLIYDTLSTGNSIYSNYGEFYDLTVNNNLSVVNTISGNNAILNTLNLNSITATNVNVTNILSSNNLITDYATVNNNLSVSNNLITDYATINHNLSVNENLITNYETVNNDLSVLGRLYANQANITNNLTVGGGVSSYNGSYVLGNVVITGNLTVSQEIFGDLVSGNTIVNSSGDTLLAKAVKTISGSSFVNGNYTVQHNLSSYDLLLTLYYVNSDSTREVVHASMINDTLSTTKISFANQPAPSDVFKLIIMS